jgi:hypothetical protein
MFPARLSLNEEELRAMIWLLVATDSGSIISGSTDDHARVLSSLAARLKKALRNRLPLAMR